MRMQKWKRFWLGVLICLVLVWLVVIFFPSNRLRLVFCNVGQGDAILFTKGFWQFLIDGGPDEKVLECLANNMPFFDHKIEVVALTHPDSDHLTGLVSVLKKYRINLVVAGPVGRNTDVYEEFLRVLEDEGICKGRPCFGNQRLRNLYAGDKIKYQNFLAEVIWPERNFAGFVFSKDAYLPGEKRAVLGIMTEKDAELNKASLVFLVKYKNKNVLLMGDADKQVNFMFIESISLPIEILKFPHHGSGSGMEKRFLEFLKPNEVVISVGKNTYGHPSEKVLQMIREVGARVRRTDLEGEIKYEW